MLTYQATYTFQDVPAGFELESGGTLPSVTLRYTVYGELNADASNAILVCHALSGSSRVADWWPQLFGHGKPFDTDQYCILGINLIGSCYGSTGPANNSGASSTAGAFPVVTVGDNVRAQARLLDALGIRKLHAVIGGSIGGMQAIEWATRYPERVEHCIAIGAAPLNALGLALNHLQRKAIMNDPAWKGGDYLEQPRAGLGQARAIAMLSYKSAELFARRYGRNPNRAGDDPLRTRTIGERSGRYDVSGYLDHQAEIFVDRFDANAYLAITRMMDNWTIDLEQLTRITAKLLLVGISSDWLFPADDVLALANQAEAAGVDVLYEELQSSHGHDAFLADAELLVPLLNEFIAPPRFQAACARSAAGAASQHV
jgi:homoserine O-acetyltransferase